MHRFQKLIKKILYKLRLLNLISKIRNKTFSLLKNGYVPKEFWNNWSDTYFHQPYRKEVDQSHFWLLEIINGFKPKSILEVGCGFGKNLDFLNKNTLYSAQLFGLDISESMLKKAKYYASNDTTLTCGDITNMPFYDNSFDLVFTHGTLMHVSSNDLTKAILELKRVAKKDLIIMEEILWYNAEQKKKNTPLNEYTFIHNYEEIIPNLGLKIKEIRKHEDFIDLICLHCQKPKYDESETYNT